MRTIVSRLHVHSGALFNGREATLFDVWVGQDRAAKEIIQPASKQAFRRQMRDIMKVWILRHHHKPPVGETSGSTLHLRSRAVNSWASFRAMMNLGVFVETRSRRRTDNLSRCGMTVQQLRLSCFNPVSAGNYLRYQFSGSTR